MRNEAQGTSNFPDEEQKSAERRTKACPARADLQASGNAVRVRVSRSVQRSRSAAQPI